MDGNQFEILFFSIYNIYQTRRVDYMISGQPGGTLPVGPVARYQMAAQFYLAVWIWRELEQKKKQINDMREQIEREDANKKWWKCQTKKTMVLSDIVELEKLPRWIMPESILFEEYYIPDKFYPLLLGFANVVKSLIFCFVVIAFSNDGTAQVVFILLVQLIYFGHTLVCNIKVSLSLRIVDVVTEALMTFYMISNWRRLCLNRRRH
jgi:hypothetical protein